MLCTCLKKLVILQTFTELSLYKETILQGGFVFSFALSLSDRELRSCIARLDILH